MIWLEVLQLGVNWVLVMLLATDIVKGWRHRKIDARLTHIEEFLRFARRPP